MPKKKKIGYENLLPDDEDLIKRSIVWGTIFEKYTKKEENQTEHLLFNFEDYANNKNEEKSSESVDPLEFEEQEQNEHDSGFDVQDTLNKTKKYVEKRKEKWHNTGLDQLMDSFNLNKIQNKVGNWLFNDDNLFRNQLTLMPDSSFTNEEVQIQNHEFYTDNDSENSVNTAEYILSSKKRSKSKVTTMTIKRFRCSNRKIRNEEKYLEDRSKRLIEFENNPNNKNETECCNKQCRSKSQKSSLPLTREIFDDIGCKLLSECEIKNKKKMEISPRKTNNNNRKISRKSLKSRNILHAKENNKSISSSSSDIAASTPSPQRQKNFKKQSIKQNNKTSQKSLNLKNHTTDNANISIESEIINFNENNNIVNSTAIIKSNNNDNRKNLSTVIENLSESIQDKLKSKKVNYNPIVLYEPDIKLSSTMITKELLIDHIGENLTEEFYEKKMRHEFDTSSKILFYPPEESESSDTDILESNAFKRKGRIVEVVDLI